MTPGRRILGGPARPRLEAALGATALAGVCAYVTAVDPNRPGHYPSCPFRWLTGLYCPGCGSLRAVHDLFNGDLAGALHCNLLLVAFLPLAFAVWGRAAVLGRPQPALPRGSGAALAVLLVLWTVARNLPLWPCPLLAPVSR